MTLTDSDGGALSDVLGSDTLSAPKDSNLDTPTADSLAIPQSQFPTPRTSQPPPNTNGNPSSDSKLSAFPNPSPTFHLKPPPPPHTLSPYQTPTTHLFQTAHFGTPYLSQSPSNYNLQISGLITKPLTLTLHDLQTLFPPTTLTSTHECYGSPLSPPPTKNLWRIGNVTWTGVRLSRILSLTGPILPGAKFIWTQGIDGGTFGGVSAETYQKDLPLPKALTPEVLLAWEINGKPLPREHGGPVRLVVPGWFGTNSVKWVERIEVREGRAEGPFTTTFYNEPDPRTGQEGETRPVWEVQVNSMIVEPKPGEVVEFGDEVEVRGWAWGCEDVEEVGVSTDGGISWVATDVEERVGFGWQGFRATLDLGVGRHGMIARARLRDGSVQPLSGTRNHCHCVEFEVVESLAGRSGSACDR